MNVQLFGQTYGITGATDTGPRSENQDRFAWVAVSSGTMHGSSAEGDIGPREDRRPDMLVAVVCDGMGGMNSGGAASSTAIRMIIERASEADFQSHASLVDVVVDAIADSDDMLMALYPGSGTTVSAVVASHGRWSSVHLGDSRCYAVYPDSVWRTNDHSPVESMRIGGLIDEDEMNEHPMSNLVSYYVGGDFADRTEVQPIVEGWSRIVLCSDGAFGYMPPADFRSLARTAEDAQNLVRAALDAQSRDNTTALMVIRSE